MRQSSESVLFHVNRGFRNIDSLACALHPETVRKHLEQELHQRQEKNGKVMALEDEKRQMEEALSGLKKKLKANERELSKEQVRVRSLNIQTEVTETPSLFCRCQNQLQ